MEQEKLNDILLGTTFDKAKMDALTMEELIEIHGVSLYLMMKNKNVEQKSKFFQSRARVFYMLILERMTTAEELFVIFSKASRLPYVVCDEKTFDDQIYVYVKEEEAVAEVEKDENSLQMVIKLEKKQLMNFYLNLYSLGINAIIVNAGEKKVRVQLKEFCKEPDYSKIPEEKRPVVNPELQLTSMYYVQELKKQYLDKNAEKKDLSDTLDEIYENLKNGKFFLMYQKPEGEEKEDGKEENQRVELPTIKFKNGDIFHPIFSDLNEALKFPNARSFSPMILDLKSIFKLLAPQVTGVILNPQSVQIIVTREVMNRAE